MITLSIHPFSRYLLFYWKPDLIYELLTRLETLVLAKQQWLTDAGKDDPEFNRKYPVVLDNVLGIASYRAGCEMFMSKHC